jgi:hypothetical protein
VGSESCERAEIKSVAEVGDSASLARLQESGSNARCHCCQHARAAPAQSLWGELKKAPGMHTIIVGNVDTHLYSFFFNSPSFSHPAPPCPTRELLPLMPQLSDKLFAIFFAIQPVWKCEYLLCSGSGRKVGTVAVALYAAI